MKNIFIAIILLTSIQGLAQHYPFEPCLFIDQEEFYSGLGYPDSLPAFYIGPESDTTDIIMVMHLDGTQTWHNIANGPRPHGRAYFISYNWPQDIDTDPGTQANTGSSTFDGEAMETEYIITHGLDYTPSTVLIQAASADACDNSWVSDITSTTFTINFQMAPTTGTDNLSFTWVAYK